MSYPATTLLTRTYTYSRACRRVDEAAAAAEIARIEDEATAVNHKFSNLAEEAAEKTKKLSKLWKRYQASMARWHGTLAAHQPVSMVKHGMAGFILLHAATVVGGRAP